MENECKKATEIERKLLSVVVRQKQCLECHLFDHNETSLNYRHHQIILHSIRLVEWCECVKRSLPISNDWLFFGKWTHVVNTDTTSLILCIWPFYFKWKANKFLYGVLAKWIHCFVCLCFALITVMYIYVFGWAYTAGVSWYSRSQKQKPTKRELSLAALSHGKHPLWVWFANYTTQNTRIIALVTTKLRLHFCTLVSLDWHLLGFFSNLRKIIL